MALVAAEGEPLLNWASISVVAVAEDDDQHRRRRPGPRHAVLRQFPLRLGIVAFDLIGRVVQRLLAHLLHPEDEIRIGFPIASNNSRLTVSSLTTTNSHGCEFAPDIAQPPASEVCM